MFPNRKMGLDNYIRLIMSFMLFAATAISGHDLRHGSTSMSADHHSTLLFAHIYFAVGGLATLAMTIYCYLKGK